MEFDYICSECRRRYAIEPHLMVCPDCAKKQKKGQPLRGILEVALTGKAPARIDIPSLLPVKPRFFPPIPVGNTPLWEPESLRRAVGLSPSLHQG
jgi:threonine synthase